MLLLLLVINQIISRMKTNKILLAIVVASVFIASCNTSLTVQKKQHSNGYYVSASGAEKKSQKVENAPSTKNENTVLSANEVAAVNAEAKGAEVKAAVANEVAVSLSENKNAATKPANTKIEAKSALSKKVAQVKATEQTMKMIKAPAKRSNSATDDDAVLLIILAIIIPFVAVGLATGWNQRDVVINILLTFLCGIPGIIHAFYILSREGVI